MRYQRASVLWIFGVCGCDEGYEAWKEVSGDGLVGGCFGPEGERGEEEGANAV